MTTYYRLTDEVIDSDLWDDLALLVDDKILIYLADPTEEIERLLDESIASTHILREELVAARDKVRDMKETKG